MFEDAFTSSRSLCGICMMLPHPSSRVDIDLLRSTSQDRRVKTEAFIGRKRIALVAHDKKKQDLLEWARFNRDTLARHSLFATGTTGTLVGEELALDVVRMESGPLGGDQQIGAMISKGELDFLVFFWDPLEPQPHDPDVKALLRMTVVWNIPVACNRSTADFMIASPLMSERYRPLQPEFRLAETS